MSEEKVVVEEVVEQAEKPAAQEPAEAQEAEIIENEGIENESESEESDLGLLGEDGELAQEPLFSEEDWEDVEEEVEESDEEAEEVAESVEEVAEEAKAEAAEEAPEKPAEEKPTLEYYKKFNEQAREEFKKKFNEDYDEFDDVHKDALADIKRELKQVEAEQREAQNRYQKHQAEAKKLQAAIDAAGGDKLRDAIMEYMMNLPVREYQKIDKLENVDIDFSESWKILEKVKRQMNGQAEPAPAALTQARKKAAVLKSQPPKTIRPGGGNETPRAAKEVFDLDEFGMKEEDLG